MHGLVRRVRTIDVEVRPLSGDNFKVTLDAEKSSVKEAKVEISRELGTLEEQQELYRVSVNKDGSAVREDDAEPELLEDNVAILLQDGDIVAMAVKDRPLKWRVCPTVVALSEHGAVATLCDEEYGMALVTSGLEMKEGKHFWEVHFILHVAFVLLLVTVAFLLPGGGFREHHRAWCEQA
jgi:hypothetical protein